MALHPMSAQQPYSPFSAGIGSGVELSIFTPRNHGSIYLRPFVFNFNNGSLNEMMSSGLAVNSLKSFQGAGKDALKQAIVPLAHGIPVHTYMYDSMWSFILVFDHAGGSVTTTRYGAPKRRTVLTGYFLDEPLHVASMYTSNPIFNPNAMLLFTHNSSLVLQSIFGAQHLPNLSINCNADIIPQMTATSIDGDLAMVDSATIAKCSMAGAGVGERVTCDAGAFVSSFVNESGVAHATARSPRHQLLTIAGAIDRASAHSDDTFGVHGSMGEGQPFIDPYDKFIGELHQNIATESPMPTNIGIDPRIPMTLGQLDAMFPAMKMIPYRIPINPEYEVCDQGTVNPINIMSSMVQSTIGVFASECALASIQFRYASWVAGDICGINKGQWEIMAATSMIGDDFDHHKLGAAINNFKRTLENNLFPILLAAQGEFDLTVAYDMSSSTIIDLQYLDFAETGYGFYEGHNRLGGMLSPALGDKHALHNNELQFNFLVNNLAQQFS